MKIFRNPETEECVVLICKNTQIDVVVQQLKNKFGGNWKFVQEYKQGNFLKFCDAMLFSGLFSTIDFEDFL